MPTTLNYRTILAFATGLAMAVVLAVAFQSWRADAVGADESTFVPVTPCRLLDTRSGAFNVGPRSTPLGPDEEYSLQVTGSEGECVGIPAVATAISINLVTVNPTAASFLVAYPDNVANPGTAVLNFVAGQPATPNKVDIKLAPNGRIKLFNKNGNVDVVGDVVGYYRHDGLADLEARIVGLEEPHGTLAVNPPSIAANSCQFMNFNVAGAKFGDTLLLLPSANTSPLTITPVSSLTAGQIRANVCNPTTSAYDAAAGTWRYRLFDQ